MVLTNLTISCVAGLEPASTNPVHVRKEQPAWLRRGSEAAAAAPAASSQQETSSVKLEPEHSAAVTSSASAPAISHEVDIIKLVSPTRAWRAQHSWAKVLAVWQQAWSCD